MIYTKVYDMIEKNESIYSFDDNEKNCCPFLYADYCQFSTPNCPVSHNM